MKKVIWSICLASTVVSQAHAKTNVLDLTPLWQDRFEKDCAIRDGYDSYEDEKGIHSKFKPYVVKEQNEEEQAYASTELMLKNVQYRGVPVKKINFSYGNMSKQLHQVMYLDLSSAQAKANFKKIKWTAVKKDNGFTALSTEKRGNLMEVRCSWLDPQHRF